jgi:hypothetical protein
MGASGNRVKKAFEDNLYLHGPIMEARSWSQNLKNPRYWVGPRGVEPKLKLKIGAIPGLPETDLTPQRLSSGLFWGRPYRHRSRATRYLKCSTRLANENSRTALWPQPSRSGRNCGHDI